MFFWNAINLHFVTWKLQMQNMYSLVDKCIAGAFRFANSQTFKYRPELFFWNWLWIASYNSFKVERAPGADDLMKS